MIGDSQVRADAVNVAALELITEDGRIGLGFVQALFHPLPSQSEIVRIFEDEAWPGLVGQPPLALIHRVNRPRGGNASLAGEAVGLRRAGCPSRGGIRRA